MAAPRVPLTGDIAAIAVKGRVSAKDVLTLRRTVFADGIVSSNELATLFALGEHAPEGDREWHDFFAEAAADFYLREEEPHGYLTAEEFADLKAKVTHDGVKASALDLGLLVKLLETARQTPTEMTGFVAEQIKKMVAQKDGGPSISESDAELVRRFLFAAGGDGHVAVTRAEAELLFDLNDMTADADNHPAWSDLFIKGIANHLMAHVGYRAPSREEALARQAWLEDQSVNIGGFFKRMFSGGLDAVREAYTRESEFATRNAAFDTAAAAAEQVTDNEADWLAERIKADGALHDNERALIAYMRELEADLPPKLKALVDRAA